MLALHTVFVRHQQQQPSLCDLLRLWLHSSTRPRPPLAPVECQNFTVEPGVGHENNIFHSDRSRSWWGKLLRIDVCLPACACFYRSLSCRLTALYLHTFLNNACLGVRHSCHRRRKYYTTHRFATEKFNVDEANLSPTLFYLPGLRAATKPTSEKYNKMKLLSSIVPEAGFASSIGS